MKAYELLSSPEKWTTEVAARNKDNEQVTVDSPEACKFCIYGAIRKCYGEPESIPKEVILNLQKVMDKFNFSSTNELFKWNDSSIYEEVVSVLKELEI